MAQVGNIRLAHAGVPEFCHISWTQIGNIRFAVVKPAGDGGDKINVRGRL